MRPATSFESFLKFTLGFFVFISVSFGVTFFVTAVSQEQEKEAEVAATFEALIEK